MRACVTLKEIGEFFQSISEASDARLSDEELDAVAGGKGERPTATNIFTCGIGGSDGIFASKVRDLECHMWIK